MDRAKRNERQRAWAANRTPEQKAADVARQSLWRKRNRDKWAKRMRDWCKRWPQKARAQSKLRQAVRYGKIARPNNCQKCGAQSRVEGHHADYSKPYDVAWLCRPCHLAEHGKKPSSQINH